MGRLVDYSSYNGFWSLLLKTKKYRELFEGSDALISFACSISTTGIIWYLYETISTQALNALLKNTLVTLGTGLIGLLGFLVSGLAILTGMITNKVIGKLDNQEKIDGLVEILFSFYFEGGIIGLAIFGFLNCYFITHIELDTIKWLFLFLCWLLSYFFWFSIVYAVGLIGTCINIFFVNVYYDMDRDCSSQQEQSQQNDSGLDQ